MVCPCGPVGTDTLANRRVVADDHRVDQAIGAAIGEVRIGEAKPPPVVAVIRQAQIERQRAARSPRLCRVGFSYEHLFDTEQLAGAKDLARFCRMFGRTL